MFQPHDRRPRPASGGLLATLLVALGLLLGLSVGSAQAGKLSWLDEVVQQAIKEAEAGGKAAARVEEHAASRAGGRLLVNSADESLQAVARRSDDLSRALGRRLDQPAEAALDLRFQRVIGGDAAMARTFSTLQPAEKRLVVEMSETAQRLATRYPGQAQPMIRALGVDGLTAVRAYGDDVAEVIVKEGPESINVLRRTGRAGWSFFTNTVLPNKGKLAAAGVLGLFLANPEKFVDTAGQATQYAAEQFARAGIQLASAVGGGAAQGLGQAITDSLGLTNATLTRFVGIAAALVAATGAVLVLVGLPLRFLLWPFTLPLKLIRGRAPRRTTHATKA
jgi:hypothetical protein